jgi:hypothetical protein
VSKFWFDLVRFVSNKAKAYYCIRANRIDRRSVNLLCALSFNHVFGDFLVGHAGNPSSKFKWMLPTCRTKTAKG